MTRILLGGAALLALAACTTPIPDSGAGFNDYGSYQAERAQRDAMLESSPEVTSSQLPPSGRSDDPAIAAATSVLDGPQATEGAPLPTAAGTPAPQSVTDSAGLSEENSFDAVSAERSIEDDKTLIQQNRAQYEVVTPTDLPARPDSNAPNIVAYALQTNNPVGTPLYSRSAFASEEKGQRNCAKYETTDRAQEAFLADGGPEKDRNGLDPDGDGFACSWDPAPFRAVRGY
ncbi:hypothetical protein [Alloyangia pacifica]|uniref:hypothetical protein n=1 Tax=Alloyangia pacifica TaxID=311180 RepID=UPI001CFD180F|nr:hypothetical protein [Alloyangia pacifica]